MLRDGIEVIEIISIHALHEESDEVCTTYLHRYKFQSTLSMRRATPRIPIFFFLTTKFQSTLSMRRATIHPRGTVKAETIISIHALHEESDHTAVNNEHCDTIISIHALHEESDHCGCTNVPGVPFQSTLSMRRATTIELRTFDCWYISIHALHEESDRPSAPKIP